MPGYKRRSSHAEGTFLKWEAGETKTLRVLSKEATSKQVHWVGGKSLDCPGDDCPYCKAEDTPKVRWSLDVEVDGAQTVWEMSNQVFANLEDIAEMVGFLTDLTVMVKRVGTGMNTTYALVPMVGVQPSVVALNTEAGIAKEIKRLCVILEVDPKEQLARFLTVTSPDHAKQPVADQLKGLLAWLQQEIEKGIAADVARATGEPSAEDYFDSEDIPI